jgi:hypothetical protein
MTMTSPSVRTRGARSALAHPVAVEDVMKLACGTRRPVNGLSNTFLCEVREGAVVVARWVEFNTKEGRVERLAI